MLAEFGLRGLLSQVLARTQSGGASPSSCRAELEALFDSALVLCQGGFAEPGLMFTLFEDAINALTADGVSPGGLAEGPDAEWVFAYLEARAGALGTGAIFERGKLILLRTCNQLLKRFSQTRRASLCGRILLLLSKMLGMSERSGVNLLGRFHSENVTKLDPEVPSGDGGQAVMDREGLEIDTRLYRAIWGLQRAFSDPVRALRPSTDYPWSMVAADLGTVLMVFEETPLGGGGEEARANVDDTHAAKYLTSCKLLKLQLRDAVFRRHFLLQALILLQCLQGPRRDVTATRDVTLGKEAQSELAELRDRLLRSMEASGEGGEAFSEFLRRLHTREALWVKWKIASCPPLDKVLPQGDVGGAAEGPELPAALKAVGKRKRDAEVARARKPRPMYFLPPGVKPVSLGHPDLDRLWNLSTDNTSCLDFEDQATVPTLRDFMRPVVSQADPAEGVQREDKVQNDKVFCWKALRLMARADLAAFAKAGASHLEAAIPVLFPEEGLRLKEAGALLDPEEGLPPKEGALAEEREDLPMEEGTTTPPEVVHGKHTRFTSPQKEDPSLQRTTEAPKEGLGREEGSPAREDAAPEAVCGKHTRFTSPRKGGEDEVGDTDLPENTDRDMPSAE